MLRENDRRGATGAGKVAGLQPGGQAANFRKADTATWLALLIGATTLFIAPAYAIENSPMVEAYRKKDRKVDIKPKKQQKGIPSGLIIVYGQPLYPPFKLEWRSTKLFVNDIQAIPSITNERWWAARSVQASTGASPSTKAVYDSIQEAREMARNGSDEVAIISFLSARPHIREVTPRSPGAIQVISDENVPMIIDLPAAGSQKTSSKEKQARAEESKKRMIARVERILRRGACVIFVDGGISEVAIGSTFPSIVPQIMEDSTLSTEQKVERLSGAVVDSAARDIVANYSREAWLGK